MTALVLVVAAYLAVVAACVAHARSVRGSQVAPWGQLIALACLWPIAALALVGYRVADALHRRRGLRPWS